MKTDVAIAASMLAVFMAILGSGCVTRNTETPASVPPLHGDPGTDVNFSVSLEDFFSSFAPVYFHYDSYALAPKVLPNLNALADKMRQEPGLRAQVEGHCDERGTQEYNMALGQQRALAVQAYLVQLGISPERLSTVSYGEERPAAEGHTESAWAMNRRCEFSDTTSR